MTVSDLLAAAQGHALTDPVEIDLAGVTLAILSAQTDGNALSLTASTAHTLAMLTAQAANKSSIASLQAAQAGWDSAKTQLAMVIAKRVQDYVDKGMVHVPPHGPDEAKLLADIKAGAI